MEIHMDPRLREVARARNIGALYALIQEDPYILERIDQIPFVDTPFHRAATEGQTNFAMEIMNLRPSFARKLNQDGFSPLHLALRNERIKLVLRLLKTDKDLVRVKGREGMTPLHCVVIMGNCNLLCKFLEACPECIEDVTIQGETALHLALKSGQIEAFEVLIGWLLTNSCSKASFWERNIINLKDNAGTTVLHIAAREDQIQELKLLLDSFKWLDVKAKNSEGLTALDIVKNVQRQPRNSGENDSKFRFLKKKVHIVRRFLIKMNRVKQNLPREDLNMMLVITALVISPAFQSSLSPPGGVWQGDNSNSPTPSTTSTTSIAAHRHFLTHNGYNQSIPNRLFGEELRKAGTTIMNPQWYFGFWLLNCITFCFTILLTAFLLPWVGCFMFPLPLYFLSLSYFYSLTILSPSTTWSNINLVFVCLLACIPFPILFLMTLGVWKIKGDQKHRSYILRVLGEGKNIGIIHELRRTIKFVLCT